MLDRVENLPALPRRERESHKGTYGRVLLVAGSRGLTGAAILSGLGALRGGAGLVSLAVPEPAYALVAGAEPSYMVRPFPAGPDGQFAHESLEPVVAWAGGMSAVAVGPGCGTGAGVSNLVRRLYAELPVPLVVDADGLNCLAQGGLEPRGGTAGPRVLTPHPTEFARLLGKSTAEVQAARLELAAEFARRHQLVVLLKGAGSVITDGRRVAVNATGNPGLATGGTGDVLTGIVTALLAQGWPAFEAAQLGAWLHGRAADLAVRELSEPALIASDLPRWLGRAWLELKPAE